MRSDFYWFRVHDHVDEHPKIEPLSDAAFRLIFETWAYCRRTSNDGRIGDAVWRKRGKARPRKELLGGGLVEQHDGYVQVHDYLDWQQSADEIDAAREKKSKAGASGNHKKWHADRGLVDPSCEFCRTSPPDPEGSQVRSQMRSQNVRSSIAEVEGEGELGYVEKGGYVPNAHASTPPLFRDRCQRHGNVPEPGPCGACADVRKANAARPPLGLVPSSLRRCIVHDTSFERVCNGCEADRKAVESA